MRSPKTTQEAHKKEDEKEDPQKAVLCKIKPEEKVFLHKEDDEWFLVRPSDNVMVELKYSDPILHPIKVGDKWVLICDSKSKESGSKSKFTESLLGSRRAKQVSGDVLVQECEKSGAYTLWITTKINLHLLNRCY